MSFLKTIKREIGFTRALTRLMKNMEGIDKESSILITDDIEASVDAHRENIAFYFEGASLTYCEFDARANQIAHWALQQGFETGDAVALFMENCPDYVATWFGLSKVGVVTALINSNLDGDGLAHCVNIASAKAVIAGDNLASRVEKISGQLNSGPVLWSFGGGIGQDLNAVLPKLSTERPGREYRAKLRGADLFLLVYTSGTTGLPKAAKISHVRARRSFRIAITTCKLTDKDRVYITLPLYHVTGGFLGLGGSMLSGAATVLRRKFSASQYWDDVCDYDATVIIYIGELCRYLLNQPEHPKERSHNIRVGIGNGLRQDIWQKFVDRFNIPNLLEIYGSTEGNVFLMNFDGKVGAVGRIPKYLEKKFGDVRIVKFDVAEEQPVRGDDGFCITADLGEPGELLGKIDDNSPSDFSGYHDKKATEKKILRDVLEPGDAWFRTGDLMSKDREGYIYFIDRIGDTFRWKGENVATNEVAEALSQFPGITTANVYGVEIANMDGRAGMAAITTDESFNITGLRDYLFRALPHYAVPVFIREQPEADTTGTFKYRKVELVQEGFDVTKVRDPLWFLDPDGDEFQKLGEREYETIRQGGYRF